MLGRVRNGCRSFASAQDDTFCICGLSRAGDSVELDFAGLAVAGLDGVYDSRSYFRANRESVDEDEDGLGEVEFEEGFGGGEFDDFSGLSFDLLIQTVVAAAAEFGEAVFEGVGERRKA